jgi:hypothetical protein
MKIIRQKSVGDVRDFDSRRMKLYIYTHKYGVRKYTFLGRNDKRVELNLYHIYPTLVLYWISHDVEFITYARIP